MKEGIKGFSLYVPRALFVMLGILVAFLEAIKCTALAMINWAQPARKPLAVDLTWTVFPITTRDSLIQ